MNVSYLYINISACLLFSLMFVAFMAAEKSKEMRAWIVLLGDMALWSLGSLFMRLNVFPSYQFWYYVSLLALFSIAFLVYNYVYQFANYKNGLVRLIWFIGTVIILVISATGYFLAPPEMLTNEQGNAVFKYAMDWRIAIPSVFFMCIVASIIRMFRRILEEKGTRAPGVMEIIIGCFVLALGNIIQILPGNTFPWDTLFGAAFAIMLMLSLYKRRMFNTKLIISSSILVAFSSVMCAATAAYFFPRVAALFEEVGGHLASPPVEAFIFLSVILFIAIVLFKRLLSAIFSDEEQRGYIIKRYSDIVSKTLDIDSILRETVRVIKNELTVNQMYICLLQDGKYVPVCSAMPLKPATFTIAADHPCVKYFEKANNNSNHIVLREFETNPLYKSLWGSEKELFNKHDISTIVALKDGNSVVGLLLLAEKEKRMGYTYSDFSFLNTISAIASIAVKNAALYKQVAQREYLFSSMTEFIPTAILIKQKGEDSFCFVSANTERVLGLSASYFRERSARKALVDGLGEERAAEIVSTLSGSSKAYTCDIPFINRKDCRELTIRCAFSPIINNGIVTHYVCTVNDISGDIAAQELLKNSVEIAQNSSKAKGEFLSQMSHEIRTPMNSIAGLTYLARELVGKDNEDELSEYLNQIDQSSQYLLSLLNNIMDMSKIESQKYEVQSKPFDVEKVLDEVYSVYSVQMSAKSVEFTLDTAGLSYKNILGDEISLRKILNNLLSNAYKFTGSGGKVSLSVEQKLTGDKSVMMQFRVSDTGVGISEQFMQHLFEPYTQEQSENGGKAAGSGLGMAICKSMVDLQNGSIRVHSTVGKGTTFTVDIPYTLCRSVKSETNGTIDCSVLEGKRVLVVDDVMINTVITKRLLEKYGVLVDCAENGREAVEKFASMPDHYYDAILMDIQMPVLNGIEAAAQIRAVKKRYAALVPIAAMTADAFIGDNQAGTGDFCDYIIKPVSPDELYGKLIKIID